MRILLPLLLLGVLLSSAAAAVTPHAFVARYNVLKSGKPAGTSVMRLQRDGENWSFSTAMEATRGLASLAGLSVRESSRFRLQHGQPEVLQYRYHLDSRLTERRRQVDVDWPGMQVHVVDDGTEATYAAVPGLVDKHMLALLLGWRLEAAPATRELAIRVTTRNQVEAQHFRITGPETITGPAGTHAAIRLERTDPGKHFIAWYVPGRYALPVQLKHGEYSLQLRAFEQDAGLAQPVD